MKKNFIFRLLPLIALAITLQSCRTNEDLLSGKEESYYSNKFQVFTSLNNKPVDYAKGFSILFEKYDSIHGTSYTRAALLKKGNFNKNDAEFVEFNLRSQEMLLDDGERWIVYPIIKNNQVGGLMVGILRNEETEVEFRALDSGSSYYTEVIQVFRMAFMKSNLKQRSGNTTSRCGFDGSDACDIEEVIISPPPRPRPGGGGPKGGCTGLNNCMNPDIGGGGGPGGNSPIVNPCDKIKSIINNSKMAAGLQELKDQSTLPKTHADYGEKGIKFKADGTPSATIIGQDHSVNFGDKTGYTGGYHNHTVAGIPMLSPPDIDQLLGFARAQGNYGDPTKAYMGMIAPNGMHYVIWFNGTYQDAITNFSQDDLNTYITRYQTRYGMYKPTSGSISNEAIESFLMKTLKDMGLDGKVNLQRIESDGTVKNIINNGNGTITPIPC